MLALGGKKRKNHASLYSIKLFLYKEKSRYRWLCSEFFQVLNKNKNIVNFSTSKILSLLLLHLNFTTTPTATFVVSIFPNLNINIKLGPFMKKNISICLPGPGGFTQYDHFQNYLLTSRLNCFIFLFCKVIVYCVPPSIIHSSWKGWRMGKMRWQKAEPNWSVHEKGVRKPSLSPQKKINSNVWWYERKGS